MSGRRIKRVGFLLQVKKLSCLYTHSRKALECLLQNIYLLLDLLYHKHNPLIMATKWESIF